MRADKPVLLMAGAGYADIPLIQAGRALGFRVVTSGNRASDLGHRYSHECRLADFSDPQAILAIARDIGARAVCACCNDFSALSCAYVAEQLGLPGHDPLAVAQTVHHKDRYRAFALANEIPSPQARGFDTTSAALSGMESLRFPVIVKPVDLTGGKGVSVAATPAQAERSIRRAFAISRSRRIVIEEFITGSRHGITTFIRGGVVVFHFHDDEYYHQNPYLVSAASAPGRSPETAVRTLVATIERIAGLLRLVDGIVHVQYILTADGSPVIIEICRRAPGDLYVKLVSHATGIDYGNYIVRASAGLDSDDLTQRPPRGCWTRYCVMAPTNGVVRDVRFDPLIRALVADQLMWWKPGDRIDDYRNQKLGIVFLRFDSVARMRSVTEELPALIKVVLE